jgi:pimeloyl-ACP methyl ester carboxylesterase
VYDSISGRQNTVVPDRSDSRPATFVLIPGAGGVGWYWHRVVARLHLAGHPAVAVDLPGDDETAGLPEYTRLVLDAIGDRTDVVLVAQSLGGFTAPLVAARTRVDAVVLVNAMIPVPGETPGAWWDNTGWSVARIAAAEQRGYRPDFDLDTYFLHDVAPDIAAAGLPFQRPEADVVFGSVCDFDAWPSVPIHVVAGVDDRFFPLEFQRTVARDRLGLAIDERPGGHLIALAQPRALADYLLQAVRSD